MTYPQNILLLVLIVHGILPGSINPSRMTNVATSLKPLTPIARTNLYENTLYKWHDHTKPGCFLVGLAEGGRNVLTMVCNKVDQQWYNTLHASWIFDEDGHITNAATGLSLAIVGNDGADNIDFSVHLVDDSYYMWVFESDVTNKNHLRIHRYNLYIVPVPLMNHRYSFRGTWPDQNDVGFQYSFFPAIDLEAQMYNFKFTRPLDQEIALHTSKKDLIDSYDINNASPGMVSRLVRVSEKVTNDFSWGLAESLKGFAKVKTTAGIPFFGQVEAEFGMEGSFGSKQDWRNSVDKTFELSYNVQLPPYTKVKVSAWYERIQDISMNYMAETEITGKITRISVYDDLVPDSLATGEMIRRQLEYVSFDGNVVAIKEHSVIAQFKGTMTASVGVRGQLSVNEDTVNTEERPQ